MDNLNEEQRNAFEEILKGKNVFLTGCAGTGKTHLLKHIINYCKLKMISLAVTSLTGISAILLDGTTLHSWAGILLGDDTKENLLELVYCKREKTDNWRNTQILIIDEVSMLKAELLHKLDYIGKKIRKKNKPMGGIQLIFSGDFAQLPPVKAKYIFLDPIWNYMVETKIELKQNMRSNNEILTQMLSEIRLGILSEKSKEILYDRLFVDIDKDDIKPTQLFSTCLTVDDINLNELQKLINYNNKEYKYKAYDVIINTKNYKLTTNQEQMFINQLDKNVRLLKTLNLCVGAQVMLTSNIDVYGGLVNGSRGIVTECNSRCIKVKFIDNSEIYIDQIKFEYKIDKNISVIRKQYPLILAWAQTIHKCQGATIDLVSIDLGSSIFEYGQAYTALSRTRTIEGISLMAFDPKSIKCSPDVYDYYSG